jgi:transposase
MAQNFIGCDREQLLLLAPDLRDWLPQNHLARFVIAMVDELDLDAVYSYYRQDGRGRSAYEPAMMIALLLYAYAVGVTSSRQIERCCVEDVAFRVISANRQPDHSTISRFLIRHQASVSDLFAQVLGLCTRAGMVQIATVAVDSTKLAANASPGQNRTLAGLEAEAARIIEDAIATDAAEDAEFGDKCGDELPADLADPNTRPQRIRELLEQARQELADAEARQAHRAQAQADHLARTGKLKGHRISARVGPKDRSLLHKKYNVTDPDSGIVRHRNMLMQGYSIQTVASEDQVILAVCATNVSPDGGQLEPMVNAARQNLAVLGRDHQIEEVLADTGYWHADQIRNLQSQQLHVLVPPKPNADKFGTHTDPAVNQMRELLAEPGQASRYRRRQQMVEPVFARMKHHRKISRVLRRGIQAVQAEIDLIATTHNLLKLRTALQTA